MEQAALNKTQKISLKIQNQENEVVFKKWIINEIKLTDNFYSVSVLNQLTLEDLKGLYRRLKEVRVYHS